MADSAGATQVPETITGEESESPTAEQQPQESDGSSDLGNESQEGEDKLAELLKSKREELGSEALELLRKLIQTDTQNFMDDGTEMDAVLILKELFEEAGIPYQIIEPKPGRGNIVARITGDGSSGRGAILLSSHLDTVRAPKENWADEGWKHSPYGGVIDEEDGCLYGRGAIDMKNMAAMSVTLLRFIKKNGIQLSRDLIFAGLADEERTDSAYGVKYLVENHPELIEADVVLNEVGGFSMFLEGKELFPIQIGEKGSSQLKITSRGPGGHGSLYHKINPIATVGEIAHKLSITRLPLRANAANRVTIENLASVLPFPKSVVFRRLLSPMFSDIIMSRLLTEDQNSSLGPLLHNTANPTVVGGGDQINQIPSSAWLIVDARILPECTVEDVVQDVQQVIGPDRFQPKQGPDGEETPPELTIEVLKYRNPHSEDLSKDVCQEAFGVIREVIKARADGAPIVPSMIPGGTDSYWYAQNPKKKPVCLGFSPVRLPEDIRFVKLFHGLNERIPVEGFKWGAGVLLEVVCKMCSAKLE